MSILNSKAGELIVSNYQYLLLNLIEIHKHGVRTLRQLNKVPIIQKGLLLLCSCKNSEIITF